MVGTPHHLPGVAIVVDVASPGERLEGDAQAVLGRPLAELVEIRGGALDSAKRIRGHVAAYHQQVAAELLHQVELALGAGERLGARGLRHSLEIAKRLEGDRRKPEVIDAAADLRRGAVKREEVVLENLDPLETGGSDGFELLVERSGEANCRDGGLHG